MSGDTVQGTGAEPVAAERHAEVLSREEFNEQYNLASLDKDTPRASTRQVLKHYVGSLVVYGGLLLFMVLNPWYQTLLSITWEGVTGYHVYFALFAAYVVLAPILLLVLRPRALWTSKSLTILKLLWRVVSVFFRGDPARLWQRVKPDYKERNAVMFLLIKLMYGPLMLHSAFLELQRISAFRFRLHFQSFWVDILDVWFLLFVSGIFLLDSSVFFLSYSTESGLMRNRLRFAETNVFRILVTIACYGPFNIVTARVLGASHYSVRILYQNDIDHPVTWILRGVAALALLGMISASLTLFTKASNLTNRGIVKIGPYALVRHPGYISKNVFWWATLFPLFIPDLQAPDFSWGTHAIVCVTTLAGLLAWGTIYFLRGITEEQFLRRDPEYVEYCRKVRYRFIPWVY